MKVSPSIHKIIKKLCKAIEERRLLYFYYESKRRKEWREIRPYMIIPNESGNLELVGLPTEELNEDKPQPGHYLLTELDMTQFQILNKSFDDPGVPRNIVINTKKQVVCRFIYDDEDEVKKGWMEIEIDKEIK